MLNMKKGKYSEEELSIIKAKYADTRTADLAKDLNRKVRSVYGIAFKMGLEKSEAFKKSELSGRLLNGNRGHSYRFKKGSIPYNKGKKQTDFMTPEQIEKSESTRFKKGHKPHNYRPVGSERWTDGYLYVKVADPNVWKQKHVLLWEDIHGKLPKNQILVFVDGDSTNIHLDNLMLVTRFEHARRNYHHLQKYPKDIQEATLAIANLKRTINKTLQENGKEQDN
jgi:hypothetical protein